jgi:tRNA-splicing ligase RtcB
MAEAAERNGVSLRPHLKTAKSIDVARLVLEDQKGGIAVSTLKEAQYFAANGIQDIQYAVGIVPDKLERAAAIQSTGARITLITDSVEVARAFANRQIIGHLVRGALADILPEARTELLFDVSHNTCKVETHEADGRPRRLYVHRKGATRAFGPGNPSLPAHLRRVGQPVFVGGSMGTSSWILAGTEESGRHAFSSACHGAGRRMSRHQARKIWRGRDVVDSLAKRGITIRSPSMRGIAEEAPDSYKDVSAVIEVTHRAGLARKVAQLRPLLCIKG